MISCTKSSPARSGRAIRSAGRSSVSPRRSRRSIATTLRALFRRRLRRARTSSWPPSATSSMRACATSWRAAFDAHAGAGLASARHGAGHRRRGRAAHQGPRTESRVLRRARPGLWRPRSLRRPGPEHHARRLDELPPVPERAREARPGLFGLLEPERLSRRGRGHRLRRLRQRRRAGAHRRRGERTAPRSRPSRSCRASCSARRIT